MLDLLKSLLLRLFYYFYTIDDEKYDKRIKELSTNASQYRKASLIQSKEQKEWRKNTSSKDYDYHLIKDRYINLYRSRKSNNVHDVMYLLRVSLKRNIGNINNPVLYDSCYGTKDLINAYINEVILCLDFIVENDKLSHNIKQEFIHNCKICYGRTALLLSGGAALSLHHIGVIKSLFEHHCLSRILSGSSGGSIIAAYIAIHTDDEFQVMLTTGRFKLEMFEPESTSWRVKLKRLIKTGNLFDAKDFERGLKRSYGEFTFLEAYNKTGRILNITVTSGTNYDMNDILNYCTSPNVLIWSAVGCSCAVPGVFQSFPLMAKDRYGNTIPWTLSDDHEWNWIDGSFDSDLPTKRLSEMFHINNFIVSQVNPHVVPFMANTLIKTTTRQIFESTANLLFKEIKLRTRQAQEFITFPFLIKKLLCVFDQKYTGDVTIRPEIPFLDYLKLLQNPNAEYLLNCIFRGEKATWFEIPYLLLT